MFFLRYYFLKNSNLHNDTKFLPINRRVNSWLKTTYNGTSASESICEDPCSAFIQSKCRFIAIEVKLSATEENGTEILIMLSSRKK